MKDSYSKELNKVFSELHVDPDKGLSSDDIKKRIIKYGYNTLPKKKNKSVFKIFLDGLKDNRVLYAGYYFQFVADDGGIL